MSSPAVVDVVGFIIGSPNGPSQEKKTARFPKAKKTKNATKGAETSELEEDEVWTSRRAQQASKERARRRSEKMEEDLSALGDPADIIAAEVDYEDAWLDNLEVDSRVVEKSQAKKIPTRGLPRNYPKEIGRLKRNIANVLQPGETIIQALKRLKGTSSDKRGKMSEATKQIFDQLTEGAVKLMENGDYNVYHEERETFEREAEGYERLAHAKEVSSGSSEKFDMFGEDDEEANVNVQLDASAVESGSASEQLPKLTSENSELSQELRSGDAEGGETDYVYDPASGYYYSSSLGYYYDPVSGLYCSVASGKWYSFDEQIGEYVECRSTASTETEGAAS
ncbi:hypothetical protein J5N97_017021 [Dioscorea zingiberensis]|uniref:OCRE domain-containing protein n=1 Tax=Dioscorea zingiberensis TaxID=325984 RepID=A0A9D5CKM4_9LILI|nr:hypothetical protein J5N97_017021 [Dioscorea zingiberensis]